MKDFPPDRSRELGFEDPFEVVDEAGRTHARRLTVEKMYQAQSFDFDIYNHGHLEFTAKEKLYIAYAVVMRYAFKTHYQAALEAGKLSAKPNIETVTYNTLLPVFTGDGAQLPDFVLDAMCYLDDHQEDGTVTAELIAEVPPLQLTAKPAGLLATRLKGNPMQPATTLSDEMARARKHTAETAPPEVRRMFGIKSEEALDPTRVGCPMLMAGQLRQLILDAIELDMLRKAKEAEED